MMHHLCTDDAQLYISIEPKGSQSFDELVKCLSDIKAQSRFYPVLKENRDTPTPSRERVKQRGRGVSILFWLEE